MWLGMREGKICGGFGEFESVCEKVKERGVKGKRKVRGE